jgi:hypothetical protein
MCRRSVGPVVMERQVVFHFRACSTLRQRPRCALATMRGVEMRAYVTCGEPAISPVGNPS